MAHHADAQVLQVLCRQVRQDLFADCIVAKGGFVLFEAEAPQPTSHVHDGVLIRPIESDNCPGETTCPEQ